MNPPGSPSSGKPVDSSVPQIHSGAGETAETGTTSTRQSVSSHPAGKQIPGNGDPALDSRLPENVQPVNATGSMASPNRPEGIEKIKHDLTRLLAVDQPLEQSFRTIKEMKYIDATVTALGKIQDKMSDKWDLPNDELIIAFKKAHKATIKQLKKDKSGDVKVTFNSPDGQKIRLIPPELDGLDLSDLKSWVQKSVELVNTLKLEKESAYNPALTGQTIIDGAQEFNTLLSQLVQLGSPEQEIQGFQARYDSIQHPAIRLHFDGINLVSSGRPANVSTPESAEPRSSIQITSDPGKASVVSDDGDSAFGDEILPPEAIEHEEKVERARKAYNALARERYYTGKANEEELGARATLMTELEYRLKGKPENDGDSGVGLGVGLPTFPRTSPAHSNRPPEPRPEWSEDVSRAIGSPVDDESSPHRRYVDGRSVHFEEEVVTWDKGVPPSSTQPLPTLPVKNDDGVGLFRALFACHTQDSYWQNASEDQVRERLIRDGVIAQRVKLAIEDASRKYLELDPQNDDWMDPYNIAQRAIAQKLNELNHQRRFVPEVFEKVIVGGKFSDESFNRLPEVLGITDLMTNDPYALEVKILSRFIMDALGIRLNVPESSGDKPGFRRLNSGFGVVPDVDHWQDDSESMRVEEPDNTSGWPPAREEIKAMPPSENDTVPGSSGDDASGADNPPPPPPPPGSFEQWLAEKKSPSVTSTGRKKS